MKANGFVIQNARQMLCALFMFSLTHAIFLFSPLNECYELKTEQNSSH